MGLLLLLLLLLLLRVVVVVVVVVLAAVVVVVVIGRCFCSRMRVERFTQNKKRAYESNRVFFSFTAGIVVTAFVR